MFRSVSTLMIIIWVYSLNLQLPSTTLPWGPNSTVSHSKLTRSPLAYSISNCTRKLTTTNQASVGFVHGYTFRKSFYFESREIPRYVIHTYGTRIPLILLILHTMAWTLDLNHMPMLRQAASCKNSGCECTSNSHEQSTQFFEPTVECIHMWVDGEVLNQYWVGPRIARWPWSS